MKNGLESQNKHDMCTKYCDKVQQCQNAIKKMTSRVDKLIIEDQNDIQDGKFWEKNQTVIYSKLGNQKKLKHKNNPNSIMSGPSNYNNHYSSVSSNNN